MLFGEPIRWETSLQLLIDALLTNGLPTLPPESTPVPHLPILGWYVFQIQQYLCTATCAKKLNDLL